MKMLSHKPVRSVSTIQRVALLPLLLLDIHPVSASVLEEVFVTAQKREENLQTTPMSITAIQGEALDMLGITSFDDVARATPSITFSPYPNSSNLLILYIRGQGVSDPAQITIDGSVGLYQDGFYISRPQASTFDLADLERVEVLRGPQGTLYGRNTTGGAVNLITKKPTGEFGLKEKLTFGNRNEFRTLTALELPAWHDLAVKLSYLDSTIDGYVENPGSGEDFGGEEQQAGRVDLSWQALDTVTVDYFFEKGNLDSTPYYYQNAAWDGQAIEVYGVTNIYPENAGEPQSKAYRPIDLDKSKSEFQTNGLTLSWEVSDTLTIRSLTGYRKLDWRAYQDFAEAFGFISTMDPDFVLQPVPITFVSDNAVDSHQVSQEFTFVGDLDEQGITYVAGLYYFDENANSDGYGEQVALGTVINTTRIVTAHARSMAVYGQGTWTPPILDENLQITLGGRYTKDERQATRDLFNYSNGVLDESKSQEGASNDDTYSKFNPAFVLAYDWDLDLSTYLRIATGYKSGGSSESGPVDEFANTVEPENVVSYEVGLKSYWWDHRLRANFAIFESQFDDMQFAIGVDPFDASVVQSYNAGDATVRGLEAELAVQPLDNVSVSLQYAYLDPDIENVEALPGTIFDPATNPAVEGYYAVGDNVADVFALPYAPEHSLMLSLDSTLLQTRGFTVVGHLDYRYQSSVFGGTSSGEAVPGRNHLKIPSFGLFNGRIALTYELSRGDSIEIALWGQNLADKEYPLQVIGLGSVVPTQNQLGQVIYGYEQSAKIWSEPRRYGIDLTYQF